MEQFNLNFIGYYRQIKSASIPKLNGVYCVYECFYNIREDTVSINKLIYIGESTNVHDRINNHERIADWRAHVRPANTLCYSCAPTEDIYRERIEAALIYEHKPVENIEYKDYFPFDATSVGTTGSNAFLSSSFTVHTKKGYSYI